MMPFTCSVPYCKGSYQSDGRVHVFSFPKNEAFKAQWLRAIKRENFVPTKHSKVCERHFKEDEIIKEVIGFDRKTRKAILVPLKHVKLSPKAVPSENLHSLTKNDIENHILDDISSVSKRKGEETFPSSSEKRTCFDNEPTDLPIITSVQSCAHDGKWLEEDLDQKVDNSDQESDAELVTDKFIWRQEAIRLLIEHYRCYKELFKSGSIKKKDIWQKIAKSLQKQGYAVTGEMCAESWHNLLSSYKDCMENNTSIGSTARKWKYYEQLHELYWKEIVSILDSQTCEKLSVGVQTTAMCNHCSSLESEFTCSSTISSSTPVFTNCNDTLTSLSTQSISNTETKDDPMLHFLKKKHHSDINWQLQMKELAFKNIKLQEQTNETLNKLTEVLIKYIQEH